MIFLSETVRKSIAFGDCSDDVSSDTSDSSIEEEIQPCTDVDALEETLLREPLKKHLPVC